MQMGCRSLIAAVAMVVLVGCERPPAGPPLAPVTGTVTLDGQPLAGATVVFVPTGSTPGWGGTGTSGDDGVYELWERKSLRLGVSPGEYKVVISKRSSPGDAGAAGDDAARPQLSAVGELLPPHYSDSGSTKLRASVGPDGGEIEFTLEMPRVERRR